MTRRVWCAVAAAAATRAAETLTRGERDRAMSELRSTRKRFLGAIGDLSAAQWKFKPASEVWSIAEIADHLVTSEKELFDLIQKKILASPAKADAKKVPDARVLEVMPDRSQKRTAPDFLAPAGQWTNQSAAAGEFKRLRDEHIAYVDQTQDNLRAHFTEHRAVGELDAYQWLLVISAHTERHVRQIEEVKANPNYPEQ